MAEPETTLDTAKRTVSKVREFAQSLEPDERAVLAALLAPGVAAAWAAGQDEVEGFGMVWNSSQLHEYLAEAIRSADFRVTST